MAFPTGLRWMVTPLSVDFCVVMLVSSRLLDASCAGSVSAPVVVSGRPTARSMSPPPSAPAEAVGEPVTESGWPR
ncbi:MAG: hypothetical protein LC795_03415 [Acidobacteria bacterium]|nr:hypothetical protein [Acidobacteriota bacterium]